MCLFSRWIFSVRAHFLQWLQKLCRIHSLVLCYVDKSHTSAFFLIFFGLLTFSLEEFHSQNFPLVFNMSQLRLLASLFCFLYVFLMNRILLSVSLCACSTLWSRRFGKRNAVVCDVLTRSARILSSKFQEVPYAECTFPHASTQTFDTCRLPAIISTLSLTWTVLSIPDTILESPEFRQV